MRRAGCLRGAARRCPRGGRRGQAAAQGLSEPLATHVATCLRCAGELRAQRALGLRARALSEATMPAPMRERIARRLRVEAAGPRGRWRSPNRRRWVAAAAIGLTLAGGTLLAGLWRRGGPPGRAPPAPAAAAGADPGGPPREAPGREPAS